MPEVAPSESCVVHMTCDERVFPLSLVPLTPVPLYQASFSHRHVFVRCLRVDAEPSTVPYNTVTHAERAGRCALCAGQKKEVYNAVHAPCNHDDAVTAPDFHSVRAFSI